MNMLDEARVDVWLAEEQGRVREGVDSVFDPESVAKLARHAERQALARPALTRGRYRR